MAAPTPALPKCEADKGKRWCVIYPGLHCQRDDCSISITESKASG